MTNCSRSIFAACHCVRFGKHRPGIYWVQGLYSHRIRTGQQEKLACDGHCRVLGLSLVWNVLAVVQDRGLGVPETLIEPSGFSANSSLSVHSAHYSLLLSQSATGLQSCCLGR